MEICHVPAYHSSTSAWRGTNSDMPKCHAQVPLRCDAQVLSEALKPSSPCATPRSLSACNTYHLDQLFPLSFTWGCKGLGAQKRCGNLVFLPGAGGSTGEISRHPATPGNRTGRGRKGLWKEAVVFITSRRGNPARQLLHQCWSLPGATSSC